MSRFCGGSREKVVCCTVVKLLLDENLSDRIIPRVIDLYPASQHVKALALTNTSDAEIWDYAKLNGFVIVSKDADFHQRSLLYGHPPKFIFLRIGNSPTSRVIQILRENFEIIQTFEESIFESILVLS